VVHVDLFLVDHLYDGVLLFQGDLLLLGDLLFQEDLLFLVFQILSFFIIFYILN
jgi:hypothetical protein